VSSQPSPNFAFLAYHDARLVALGTQAEEHFAGDPTVTLFKLRQFAEVLAQRAAARVGLFVRGEDGQQQLIDRLWLSLALDARPPLGTITPMALSQKRATTIALDPELDGLLTRAARAQRISRSEFVRQQLDLVLEQYRRHPRPRIAGMVRRLRERGDESELFRGRR
jgi:hypothetical protein